MLWTSSVPIIRSYLLYTRQLVCFMQFMWPLPSRVRLEHSSDNSWWWAQKMPETCRVLWQNKFWIFDASSWLFYTKLITIHGNLNIKCGWIRNTSTHTVHISGERYIVQHMLYHLVTYVRPYEHVNIWI